MSRAASSKFVRDLGLVLANVCVSDRPMIDRNKARFSEEDNLDHLFDKSGDASTRYGSDPFDCLIDMREYDVAYVMRVAIDLDIRVGSWHTVVNDPNEATGCRVTREKEKLDLCSPRVLAFDIECEKSPLKFPNAETDRIYMISYMMNGQGYLICNREIVSEDVNDFDYDPIPKFPGPFKVTNLPNEADCLQFFLDHVVSLRPHVIVTYNGDRFDFPYVETRLGKHGKSLYKAFGISSGQGSGRNVQVATDVQYNGRCMVHLDAFCWVQRDSYLPQGNQGLKAVTKSKLGYDPVEVDPEDMLRYAKENPHHMASYSVSDASSTFYLYQLYVHNFIFSLCTIIPLVPEEVLRKGSGTLCEALLMVEAYEANIVCPNKQVDADESFYEGHLLESETYIGGHVECLEAGVFRADIPCKFRLVPSALQHLIDNLDRDLTFALEVEHGIQRSEIVDYDEVRQKVVEKLEMLRDAPDRTECPAIYHLDVGAMYPNIILTNRLQPSSIVDIHDCASCKFNQSANSCKRPMPWTWRGEYTPAGMAEYNGVKTQLSYEKNVREKGVEPASFNELSVKDQTELVRSRLKSYSQRVYRKTKVTKIEERVSTVCMRENSFYVDTVKAFRDRRYDYKLLTKEWKGKKVAAEKQGNVAERKLAEDREILMDSLQLAHKCILNSFYGYVMRKGARWRSMEMAGIVTHTGAQIIKQARELVEQIGRPLELDTDGIWCILPSLFPQNIKFRTKEGKNVSFGYPSAILNSDVHERYTNHQYQDLVTAEGGKGRSYVTSSYCSIFFELDGPYKAMVLPASPEEGKLLKKKYVVFNFNDTIAELKGFEVKRRGELEIVKVFQSQVFEQFLAGKTLQECYDTVGEVANQWLNVLDCQGDNMDDDDLLELISEKKTISKTVEDYDGRKSTSLTTAGRLADFLGADMIKDKGLNCKLVISRLPADAPVTDRAIPVAIFSCELPMRRFFLRKWLKDNTLTCEDFRDIIDWDYYKDRLGKTIQKIITIPAGMQLIENPCPRVEHPIWLQKDLMARRGGKKQLSIKDSFASFTIKEPISLSQRRVNKGVFDTPSATQQDRSKNVGGNLASTSKRPFADAEEVVTAEELPTMEMNEEEKDVAAEVEVIESKVKAMFVEPPANTEELKAWMNSRKSTWRNRRQHRRAEESQLGSYGGSKRPAGVMDFVRNASISAKFGFWQIIEVQKLDRPGEFLVWALTSATTLQRLQVSVPRTLYVNIDKHHKQAVESALKLGGQLTAKDLPHGKPCLELFEISMPESKLIRNEKQLDLFFNAAEVEGVYESQVPLDMKLLMKAGCVAKVVNANAKNGAYSIADLEMINTKSHGYLEPKVAQFKKVFIYFACSNSRVTGINGIVGIFFVKENNLEEQTVRRAFASAVASAGLDSATFGLSGDTAPNVESAGNQGDSSPLSAKCYVWVINGKGTSNALESKPPLNRIYRKFQPNMHGEIKFTTTVVSDVAHALKAANERLEENYRLRQGPVVVIAQGGSLEANDTVGKSDFYGMDAAKWRSMLPALYDYPVAAMPANSLDEAFPALGWSIFAAERMVQRFLIFPRWFEDRLRCARFAQMPVCNIQNDAVTSMTDVLFARQLHQHRHLLWASEASNIPDVGQGVNGGSDIWYVWSDPLPEPVINNVGVYRTFVVELDLYGLAVCAIMNSAELEAEGVVNMAPPPPSNAGNGKQQSADVFGDALVANRTHGGNSVAAFSDQGCTKGFGVLKSILAHCIEEVTLKGDPIADGILTGIYRYLCGYGNGLLSDPQLHRLVYGLMVKLFGKLIGCFRNLGAQIVYADFNRILIATRSSFSRTQAEEYVDFILSAITLKKTFSFLQLSVKSYWQQLIWLDTQNWAGMKLEEEVLPTADEEVPAEADEKEEISEVPIIATDDKMTSPLVSKKPKESRLSTASANAMNDDEDEEFMAGDEENKHGQMKAEKKVSDTEFFASLQDDAVEDDNLGKIKKRLKSRPIMHYRPALEEDGDEERSNDERDEFDDEDDYYDIHEGRELMPTKRKKQYDSIGDLLDSFEEQDDDRKRQEAAWATEEQEGVEEEGDSRIEQHWNMVSNMPDSAAIYFRYMISELLLQFAEKLEAIQHQDNGHMDIDDGHGDEDYDSDKKKVKFQSPTSVAAVLSEEEAVGKAEEQMEAWIERDFTSKMLELVDDLQLSYAAAKHSGENTLSKNLALDFVKMVTHVMLQEPRHRETVATARRLLLAQLQVPEFSMDSRFANPNPPYILRDVICSYCSVCRYHIYYCFLLI